MVVVARVIVVVDEMRELRSQFCARFESNRIINVTRVCAGLCILPVVGGLAPLAR